MIFIDTNYFLRFLLNDISSQHFVAKKLIGDGAQGKRRLCTSTIVMFELYWVLQSYYEKDRTEIAAVWKNILDLEFIYLAEREILCQAVILFETSNLSLEDCYNVFCVKKMKVVDFKTFDTKLAKRFNKTI